MSAFDSEADLARLLHAGYAAPLPRSAFVEDLLGRLRQELRAERAEPRIRPKRWTLRRAAPWLAPPWPPTPMRAVFSFSLAA